VNAPASFVAAGEISTEIHVISNYFVAFVTTQLFRMTSARSTTAISVLVIEIGENYSM
jgi:hypothetical protein